MHLDLNAHEGPEDFALPVEVRVKQGMHLLDEKHGPGWVWLIDVDTLKIWHPCLCVLGQLYGGGEVPAYTRGLNDLQLIPGNGADEGFGAMNNWDDFDALTTAWRHAILARRLELQTQP